MRLARIATAAVIAAALSGCGGTVAPTSGASSPSPSAGASDATGDPVIDSATLPLLTADQVCALMTATEATTLLGSPLQQMPSGQAAGGQDTDCVYQDAEVVVAGSYIKVEINRLGFSGQATLINLHRGAHTLKVGGFEAIGADAQKDPVIEEAVLSIKLAKEVKDPALWIEAPTSTIAEQAAVLILARLAAVH